MSHCYFIKSRFGISNDTELPIVLNYSIPIYGSADGRTVDALGDSMPWTWGGWWANTLTFGKERGDTFAAALVAAAGLELSNELDLRGTAASLEWGGHECAREASALLVDAMPAVRSTPKPAPIPSQSQWR